MMEKKANYKKLSITKVFKLVDSMKITKKKPNKLSLYSDYNKKNTMKGLGLLKIKKSFRNIKINKKPLKYQFSVVNTMIGRAKSHPYRNNDMDEAIRVFEKWKKNY